MHRSRYYRNPAIYQVRTETNTNRFQNTSLSLTRSTYKRKSSTPFSPIHTREIKATAYASSQPGSVNPRFVNRSKYVWTAQNQSIPQAANISNAFPETQPTLSTSVKVEPTLQPAVEPQVSWQAPPILPTAVKLNSELSTRELTALSVSALDPPKAVIQDIAMKLNEKLYIIQKVVEVVGVKRAIKLYYDTRAKEKDGGILIQNRKRRRTPGGVFLILLRESNCVTKPEIDKVFQEIKKYELQRRPAKYHW